MIFLSGKFTKKLVDSNIDLKSKRIIDIDKAFSLNINFILKFQYSDFTKGYSNQLLKKE